MRYAHAPPFVFVKLSLIIICRKKIGLALSEY